MVIGGLVLVVAAPSGMSAEATATPASSSTSFAGVFVAAVATAEAAATAAVSSCFPGCAPDGGLVVAGSGTGSAMAGVAAVPAIIETLPTAAAASAAASILAALPFLPVAGAPSPLAVACRRGVRHVCNRRNFFNKVFNTDSSVSEDAGNYPKDYCNICISRHAEL